MAWHALTVLGPACCLLAGDDIIRVAIRKSFDFDSPLPRIFSLGRSSSDRTAKKENLLEIV